MTARPGSRRRVRGEQDPRSDGWKARGACAEAAAAGEVYPDDFYIMVGAGGSRGPAYLATRKTVMRLCAACPVRRDCLEDALATGDNEWGIRGGYEPVDRRRILKERQDRQTPAVA